MKIKIIKHEEKRQHSYYSVEFPEGTRLADIAAQVGKSRQAVNNWKTRCPKRMIPILQSLEVK